MARVVEGGVAGVLATKGVCAAVQGGGLSQSLLLDVDSEGWPTSPRNEQAEGDDGRAARLAGPVRRRGCCAMWSSLETLAVRVSRCWRPGCC